MSQGTGWHPVGGLVINSAAQNAPRANSAALTSNTWANLVALAVPTLIRPIDPIDISAASREMALFIANASSGLGERVFDVGPALPGFGEFLRRCAVFAQPGRSGDENLCAAATGYDDCVRVFGDVSGHPGEDRGNGGHRETPWWCEAFFGVWHLREMSFVITTPLDSLPATTCARA